MTPFGALIAALGLHYERAAELLEINRDTARGWYSGRRMPPQAVLDQLADLYLNLHDRARAAASTIGETVLPGATIELGYSRDEQEARAYGFSSCAIEATFFGMVIAYLGRPISLVPRGSTQATRAAAMAYGGGQGEA